MIFLIILLFIFQIFLHHLRRHIHAFCHYNIKNSLLFTFTIEFSYIFLLFVSLAPAALPGVFIIFRHGMFSCFLVQRAGK